ncbi:unnamed protein product [Psylliodes chrysocephalus]|uniref:Uncharacterized protein n=1 Tax=Psylliodes chrysocephalus TaxID=3402493 RepID=A0A9P0G7M3_9CUCU|nr:unnamed protein product [Psylliodes chrysocephala]
MMQLADLFLDQTLIRQSLISLNLDKEVKDMAGIKATDGFLFEANLTDRVKKSKALKKSGDELKTSKHKKHLNFKQPSKRLPSVGGYTPYRYTRNTPLKYVGKSGHHHTVSQKPRDRCKKRDAEFSSPDEILRDKIVLHASDKDTQDKLIRQGDVQLKEAIEVFRVAEITRRHTKDIHRNVVDKIKEIVKRQVKVEVKNVRERFILDKEETREKTAEVIIKMPEKEGVNDVMVYIGIITAQLQESSVQNVKSTIISQQYSLQRQVIVAVYSDDLTRVRPKPEFGWLGFAAGGGQDYFVQLSHQYRFDKDLFFGNYLTVWVILVY